jgi:hypothetical protein
LAVEVDLDWFPAENNTHVATPGTPSHRERTSRGKAHCHGSEARKLSVVTLHNELREQERGSWRAASSCFSDSLSPVGRASSSVKSFAAELVPVAGGLDQPPWAIEHLTA